MATAIYPGTFDPVTLGHLDIIRRSSKLFDVVIVGVLHNSSKRPLFSEEERVNMLRRVTENMENVRICTFQGLLADFFKETNADVVIRGLRDAADCSYELSMASVNRMLNRDVETVYLPARPEYAAVSSSVVREILSCGGSAEGFVPEEILPCFHK